MFDNEIELAVAFLQDIERTTIRSDSQDQWIWVAEPSGCYSARSAYRVIREGIPTEGQDGGFRELWKL